MLFSCACAWSRLASTSSTYPAIPTESIGHMKLKRSCPGVPNSVTTLSPRSPARRTVPWSIATVVCSLRRDVSSDTPRSAPTASSHSVVTNVVLPAPKGPATTILVTSVIATRPAVRPPSPGARR